ncbi:hypothetical protein [Streptomyces sp. NPDC048527]|uniref:hypothetical protein n=1 Tax=Streptomyces sp. NPDC048527 TaxID=3365568 RepID=UPI0037200A39
MATPGEGENQDGTQHVTTVHGADSPPNGQLQQGTTDPTQTVGTMQLADGEVLTAHVINGQEMWGHDSQDGWFSQDGTVFIPSSGEGAGIPQIGLTAPDGHFLEHGEVRWIKDQQVWGTLQEDKSFLSEDQTQVQLSDGTVEKSMVTSDNQILTQRLVNGQEMWGQDSQDGWFSQDGTVFTPKSGEGAGIPQIGLTDPDGHFLLNGEVRWIKGQQVWGSVQEDKSFLSEDGTLLQLSDGTVEKSMVSDNQILTQRIVDAKEMWGQESKDGWFSQDGTVFIPNSGDGAGVPQKGITAPDGKFLLNGEVRWIKGQQVYGSVDPRDGSFLSEDGTLLQLSDGTVEKSMVTSDNKILTQRIVDGKEMWGQDSKDGWFSQDGTVFIPNFTDGKGNVKGVPQYGLTTPDGQFLNGGVTKTLPDGTVLYGYMSGGDFYSYDGKTLVLADGTIVHGSMDMKTGIFTAADGTIYMVTDTGIQRATLQSDGSYLLANGQDVMTTASWMISLWAFADSMKKLQDMSYVISYDIGVIKDQYSLIESIWNSPAGQSFVDLTTRVNKVTGDFETLLTDMQACMKTTYDNYVQVEQANILNSTGS